jgi:hypothetical protein
MNDVVPLLGPRDLPTGGHEGLPAGGQPVTVCVDQPETTEARTAPDRFLFVSRPVSGRAEVPAFRRG